MAPGRLRAWAAIAVVLGLAAGACRGSAAQPEDDEPHGRMPDTPLSRFLGSDAGGTEARFSKQRRQQQQLVADCMARRGFEYVPVDPPTRAGPVAASPDGKAANLTRRQYLDRYGFGISTVITASGTASYSAPASTSGTSSSTSTTAFDDPNSAIVRALSADARRAYETALYGTGGATAASGGCQSEAMAALAARPVDAVIPQVEAELNQLYQQVTADSRVLAASRSYATCMANAGYHGVRQPQDALDLVNQRLLQARTIASPPPPDGAAPSYDRKLLAETRRYELRVAKDDYRCGLPLERERLAVQRELEQGFIDRNRDLLERYRAALAASG